MLCRVHSRAAAGPESMLAVLPTAARPSGAREARPVAKERAENFPVALRLLPRGVRMDLRAVYDVVRLIDDLGDEAEGDRTAQLQALSAELADLWACRPVHT